MHFLFLFLFIFYTLCGSIGGHENDPESTALELLTCPWGIFLERLRDYNIHEFSLHIMISTFLGIHKGI